MCIRDSNYRLSNILAALGRAQLTRLDDMIARRRVLRDRYKTIFAEVPGVQVFGAENDESDNVWLTSIIVDPRLSNWTPSSLSAALSEENIESRPLWKPMHLQPVFSGARGEITGASEKLFENGLTLPSGSALSENQFDRVQNTIAEFLRARH